MDDDKLLDKLQQQLKEVRATVLELYKGAVLHRDISLQKVYKIEKDALKYLHTKYKD